MHADFKWAVERSESPDFDFRHHLYDTIILLGGKKDIADLIKKSLDLGVKDVDVLLLRNYNCDLIDEAKKRLTQINTTKIRVSPDIQPQAND